MAISIPFYLGQLNLFDFSLAAFCAFLLGVSKSGIKGIAALIVTGFALTFARVVCRKRNIMHLVVIPLPSGYRLCFSQL